MQRSRSVLKEVEPGYWMELAVSVPFTKKKKGNAKISGSEGGGSAGAAPGAGAAASSTAAAAPGAAASPTASHVIEYEPENVHDSVLDAMLSHSYEMFR